MHAHRLLHVVGSLLIAACGGALPRGDDTSTDQESVTSEPLPIAAEETAETETQTEEAPEEPPCEFDPSAPPAAQQTARFVRWLRDQAVGRHVSIDDVSALCGDSGGFLTLEVDLHGPAGGLDSLGRALPLYYPGATWSVIAHERLDGEGIPLEVTVDVRIPVGTEPRPRCTWDASVTCP